MSRSKLVKPAVGFAALLSMTLSNPLTAEARPVYAQPSAPVQSEQRPYNPAYAGVPNVPDDNGCVKWCFRDLGPCDPPEFKRVDGRCAFPN